MGEKVFSNSIRFVLYFLFQVAILKRVDLQLGEFSYIHFLVYPIAILLLPLNTPRALILFLAFLMGISIDSFYNSPGVHAGVLVFTAYFRNLVLRMLEPYEGYATDLTPTLSKMGFTWFISYLSINLFVHCFIYFSLESFSFVFIFSIILNTIFSFISSLIVILLIQFIFRPKI